ncbi:glycosyltransferase family 9 protein [Caballeronia novacaledonica]|uniref:Glycosyltransferase family 9 (Heptosyltransferase) n=1 Tax=Caballeronia novacaledonica TaxID=1544861 RepID=A0AA37MUY9_9BURK|nr:glycosyltransferase family 9 protein [Caballeronia novacaledonica]GJH30162.1 hypothetical protein CBA19CS42_36620 [Caballeronia novacaledonica]
MTVAVFAANGIGDALMMWPTLRALSIGYRGDVILASDTRITNALYRDIEFKGRVHVRMNRESGTRRFDAAALARALPACETFVCLNSWHSSSTNELLADLSGSRSVGFFAPFDVTLDVRGLNAFDAYFKAAECLTRCSDIGAYAGAPVFHSARRIIEPRQGRLFVTMHIETARAKDWNRANAALVVRALRVRLPNADVSLVCSNRQRWRRLSAGAGASLLGGHAFESAADAVARSDLFIGCDSCMLHVADLARVPTVAAFRSTSPAMWGCRFTRNETIWLSRAAGVVRADIVLDAAARLVGARGTRTRAAPFRH